MQQAGFTLDHGEFFDTVVVRAPGRAADVVADARAHGVLLRLIDGERVGISCGETTTEGHVDVVLRAFGAADGGERPVRRLCPSRSCAGDRS